jgi:hypothetical protein
MALVAVSMAWGADVQFVRAASEAIGEDVPPAEVGAIWEAIRARRGA